MARSRRELRGQVDIWPGFVDALSTLLMAITFLLVVYVLTQFLMNQLLEGRTDEMMRLQTQARDLAQRLELEQDAAAELRRNISQLSADLQAALGARDDVESELQQSEAERDQLAQQMTLLSDEQRLLQRTLEEMRLGRTQAEQQVTSLRQELDEARGVITADREQIELQLGQLVQLRRDIDALTEVRAELERQVAEAAAALQTAESERRELAGELDTVQAELGSVRTELGAARDQASALEARLQTAEERTVLAQRELEARELRIEELLRSASELEAEREQVSAAEADARAEVATLNRMIQTLSDQLRQLDQALELKQVEIDMQSSQIAELGQRLNIALASKVEELTQFRSEFFGRLRQVLGVREDVRIAGDRFVFQSEVLFGTGEAVINAQGREQLATLADTLKDIIAEIPSELPWVLQVDGHTDVRPINTPRFPSNWELSTARAISVAQFLVSQGIPASRVAATGFAEFQPLDPAMNEEAFRRNRRIEIKLTTR